MAFWDRWKRRKPTDAPATGRSLVTWVRDALAAVEPDRAGRALERAWAEAEAGRGAEAAAALGPLGDRERLFASAAIGATYATVAVAVASGVEAARAGRAIEWNGPHWCDLLERWLRAIVDEVGVERCCRLLDGGYHGARGQVLLGLVRDRLARGKLDEARALHAAIDPLTKRERAVARAAIAIASGLEREQRAAIDDATCEPIIQEGGEEAQALAAVLEELQVLSPRAAVITTIVEDLFRRALEPTEKGHGQWGAYEGGLTCVRAASLDPAWLDHARRLREALVRESMVEELDNAIAGQMPPAQDAKPMPSLAVIRAMKQADVRLDRACERVAWACAAGEGGEVLSALRAGIAAPDDAAPKVGERVDWARALAAGGRRDEAAAVLLAVARGARLPARGYALALDVLDAAGARRLVTDQIDAGAATADLREVRYDPHEPAAVPLTQLAVRSGDEAVEAALVAAVEAIGDYEDPVKYPQAESTRWRLTRIDGLHRALDEAHGRPVAPVVEEKPDLDAALADLDARIATTRDPEYRNDLAEERVSLVARRGKRDVLEHLRRGNWDQAIAIALDQPDSRYSGEGPKALVLAIVEALDANKAWAAHRAQGLARVIAGPNMIPQDVLTPAFALLTSAGKQGSLMLQSAWPPIKEARDKFRLPADGLGVGAAWAAALALTGDGRQAEEVLRPSLAAIGRVRKTIHLRASYLVRCVRTASAMRDVARRELWTAAVESIGYLHGERDQVDEMKAIAPAFRDEELPWAVEILGGDTLSDKARAALVAAILEHIAERATSGGEIAAGLVARAREPGDAFRAARSVARHLARHGKHDDATAIATLCGLA